MLKLLNNRKPMSNRYTNDYMFSSVPNFDEHIRFGTIITWICWICIGSLTLFLLLMGGAQLYRSITTSNFFTIERINIYGAVFFRKSDILHAAKLQTGINSFSVNIGTIEKVLSNNPWVEKVSIKRRLPGIFDIFIKEYEPAFWIVKDGIIYYADNSGRIIIPIELEHFRSLPTLEILEGGENLLPIVKELTEVIQLSKIIDLSSLSTIYLSSVKGIELVLENNLVLCLDAQAWKQSLQRILLVLSDLANKGELKRTTCISALGEGIWVTQDKNT